MNLKQPYEQSMAGKLRQLPVPDQDRSWEQMKKLLDDDDHKTGGGGKRSPGGNPWWGLGVIALIVGTAGWFYMQNQRQQPSLAKNPESQSPSAANTAADSKNSSVTQNNTIAQNYTPVSNQSVSANTTVESNQSAETKSTTNHTAVAETPGSPNSNLGESEHDNASNNAAIDQKSVRGTNHDINPKAAQSAGMRTKGNRGTGNDILLAGTSGGAAAGGASHKNGRASNGAETFSGHGSDNDFSGVQQSQPNGQNSIQNNNWFGRTSSVTTNSYTPSYNTSMAVGDSLAHPADLSTMLSPETKKAVARAQRDVLNNKKEKKSFELDLSDLFHAPSFHVDTDPKWAAGIALNYSAAVADQSRYNYNISGNSGTLLDYIPSPYLQFHLNRIVYLQTELNFSMPQFIAPTLVYQNAGASQSAVYIQKLYYFNWPISLHYSPVTNLYLSGGLQFSSFQSGLASVQQQNGAGTYNTTLKFKDDSIAATIKPNEWRWQTGADYYWNRFTIGVRYNQSFSQLFNSNKGSTTVPMPNTKNSALIFYLKFNLFESKSSSEENKKDL